MDNDNDPQDILETNISKLLTDGTDVPPLAAERSAQIVDALKLQGAAMPASESRKGFSLASLCLVAAVAALLGFAGSSLFKSQNQKGPVASVPDSEDKIVQASPATNAVPNLVVSATNSPSMYEIVEKVVMVKPATQRVESTTNAPAHYETVTEKVLANEADTPIDMPANPSNATDHPPYASFFYVTNMVNQRVRMGLRSKSRIAPNRYFFNLVLPSGKTQSAAKLGQTYEGFKLIGFEEKQEMIETLDKWGERLVTKKIDVSELTVERISNGRTFTLVEGKGTIINDVSAVVRSVLDPAFSAPIDEWQNKSFSFKGERFEVQKLMPNQAEIKQLDRGDEIAMIGSSPQQTPRYETRVTRVLVKPATQRVETIPAQYETATERVLVRSAGVRGEVIPGKYEWVEEQVVVAEPGEELVVTPAKYETRESRVMVKPGTTDASAEYKTVQQRVMVSPPTTTTKRTPAQFDTVRVRKMVEPPRQRTVDAQPEYGTVTRQRLVKPASTRVVEVPAEYKTVTQRVLVAPSKPVAKTAESLEVEPGKQETSQEQVMVSPPTHRVEVVPPQFETVTEQVLVKEAGSRIDVMPGRYEWVEEQVLVADSSEELVVTPAKYETRESRVMVKPGTADVPPEYKTVTQRVMVSPPQTTKRRPPQFDTVRVRRLVEGPKERSVSVPAEYKTVTRQRLVTPTSTRLVEIPPGTAKMIPAEYKTVKQRVMVTPPAFVPQPDGTMVVTPAKFEERDTRVMVQAAYTVPAAPSRDMKLIPPKFEWVDRPVLTAEAAEELAVVPAMYEIRMERVEVSPGEYKEVAKRVVVKPASTRSVPVPARYDTVRIRKLVEPARWVPKNQAPKHPEANAEQYQRIVENPFLGPLDSPLSTFSIDVDTASYANTRRFFNSGKRPPPDAVRIEELINYFNYDDPEPEDDTPFAVATEVAACPWTPENRIVRIGLQAKRIDQKDVPPRNLVFLIDVSGSMSSSKKLQLLQSALPLLVEQLRPEDRLGIVAYAGRAGVVLEPTEGTDQDKILKAIAGLRSGGSTHGSQGIQRAYEMARKQFDPEGINRVILATDGDFNVGLTGGDLTRLIEKERKSGVFLSVLGFGTGNINDRQMEELSNKGNGNYAYIDSMKEATKVLVEDVGGTLYAVAKDVKIQVEFNPATVASYRLIGYENRKMAAQDFHDDKKDAGEIGAGHSVTALYEIVPATERKPAAAELPPLKYQNARQAKDAKNAKDANDANDKELLTVNLRYKQPDEDKSQLLSVAVGTDKTAWQDASENLRFASAVAGFGMILRGSVHKGAADWKLVRELAGTAIGDDKAGHRAEFLELIDAASAVK